MSRKRALQRNAPRGMRRIEGAAGSPAPRDPLHEERDPFFSTLLVDGPRLLGQARRHAGAGSRADRARLPGGGPRGGAAARRASAPSPPWAPTPEVRRRRREGWIIAGIIVAVVLLAIAQFRLPQSLGSGSLGTDAILIGLINVNLILLVLLVFLVGRNIAKLVFERRRRIMGAHLRTRLVVAFVAIALLPATLLFLVGLVFVGNSIERWFNGQVERALEGAL